MWWVFLWCDFSEEPNDLSDCEDVKVLFLWKPRKFYSQGGDLESSGDLSWEDLLDKPEDLSDRESEACEVVPVVPDVTVVLVSPSSVVTECSGDVSLDSDCEFVEPQSSSFSKKRAFVGTVAQEEMRYECSPVKAPPPSRRRMMQPTPQQSSYSPIEERQWHIEVEDQVWNIRDRTVTARMEQYLGKSDSLKGES